MYLYVRTALTPQRHTKCTFNTIQYNTIFHFSIESTNVERICFSGADIGNGYGLFSEG